MEIYLLLTRFNLNLLMVDRLCNQARELKTIVTLVCPLCKDHFGMNMLSFLLKEIVY